MAQDNKSRFNLDKESEKVAQKAAETVENAAEEAQAEVENLKEAPAPQPLPEEKASRGWVKASFWIMGILLVIILIMLWKFCDRQEEKPSSLMEAPTEVAAVAADAVDSVADMAGDAGEAVAEAAGDAVDAVGDAAGKATAAVGAVAEKTTAAVGGAADRAVEATSSAVAAVSSDVQKEALNVIKGAYGNGAERRRKLGAQYQEIQNRVNQLKRQGAF